MTVTVADQRGMPLMCGTEGCGAPASSVWSAVWDSQQHVACDLHNPMAMTTVLPVNFTSQSLCHACGQPVRLT